MKAQLLINARIVFADHIREDASLLIENGVIAAINPNHTTHAEVIDLNGQLLMPGLIDLHCDALEKEVEPRPGVQFPLAFACAQVDRRNAAAGITTVYHALSFANHELGVRNNDTAAELARAVNQWNQRALVDNRIHVRYEVTDETAPPILSNLLMQGQAQMISFMDHTPGQGQFKDVAAFRAFHARTYRKTDDELDAMLAEKQQKAAGAFERIEYLAAIARDSGVAIASHDDDNPERITTVKEVGTTISEFPINHETAKAAQTQGLYTVFGAPNVLRGQSQSGSMRAIDAIIAGVADCLCGDYSPAALLPAAIQAADLADISLPEAIRLVTLNPAKAAGLNDRGEIREGLRADLIAVDEISGMPQATQVWVAGSPVLDTQYPFNMALAG